MFNTSQHLPCKLSRERESYCGRVVIYVFDFKRRRCHLDGFEGRHNLPLRDLEEYSERPLIFQKFVIITSTERRWRGVL